MEQLFKRQGGVIPEDAPWHHPLKQPSFAEVEDIYTNPAHSVSPKSVPQIMARTQPAKKEFADVETLYRTNEAVITQKTQGLTMSAVSAKEESELPVRINSRGTVLQGFFRVAAASIRNQNTIDVLVEQD